MKDLMKRNKKLTKELESYDEIEIQFLFQCVLAHRQLKKEQTNELTPEQSYKKSVNFLKSRCK